MVLVARVLIGTIVVCADNEAISVALRIECETGRETSEDARPVANANKLVSGIIYDRPICIGDENGPTRITFHHIGPNIFESSGRSVDLAGRSNQNGSLALTSRLAS